MFRLPFVSRERYDERVSEYKTELAALQAERRKLHDYIALMSLGRPIFEPVAPVPDSNTPQPSTATPPTPDDMFAVDVQDAIRHGRTKARDIAEFISNKNSVRARDARVRNTTDSAAAAIASAVDAFDTAVAEGEKENA